MKNIVAIFDGMGNQMFHYALSLAINNGGKIECNDYLANKHSNYGPALSAAFGIEIKNKFVTNWLIRFTRKCVMFSLKKQYRVITLPLINGMEFLGIRIITDYDIKMIENKLFKPFIQIYCGRFQSEKYFKGKKEEVQKSFTFDKNKVSEKSQPIAKKIAAENSVSIHIRRGDYLDKKNLAIFENICTLDYYNKAVQYMIKHVERPVFYVFSDDILWTKEKLNLPNAFFIDWNSGSNSWEDMFLMSLCKHNIIANSTFSWWGAWLNRNENKIVVCPAKYTNIYASNEFFPADWHKMNG
ncbi:alpha-1,2-fucosyltransferase [Bacteroidia bacterium]|nr:alpha-1,2-fucosyltransferase [Bacteroidia bacterium]